MPDEIDDPVEESIELRRFDLHSVWRVLLWGASAAMAVAVVAGTAFSELGAERLQQAFASLIEPAKTEQKTAQPQTAKLATPAPQLTPQTAPHVMPQQLVALEKQTRELTQTVQDLTAERDRFKARLASLEQNLDDITGAIRKQTAQASQFAAQLAAQAPRESLKQAAAPPPAVSAPATIAAIPSPAATPASMPETPAATASTPPVTDAAAPIAGPIPLPPTRTAALEPPDENAAARELGVDLGGAASLDALRAYWAGVKANIGPDLVGLIPSYTIRQKQNGVSDYRLVLGPLPNSAAAIRLCARLAASSRAYCRPGTFSVHRLGDRLAAPERPRTTEQLPTPGRDNILLR